MRLKWLKEPPGELQLRVGESARVDCDASGSPAPLISWSSVRGESRGTIQSAAYLSAAVAGRT